MSLARPTIGVVFLVVSSVWLLSLARVTSLSAIPLPNAEPADLLKLRSEGNRHFAAQRYDEALALYERGFREALARNEKRPAVRFLNNMAGCQFALARYQKAAELYLRAQRMGRPLGFPEMMAMISLNLAGIYLQMGSAAPAAQAAEEGLRMLDGQPEVPFRARLLVQLGNARAWAGRHDSALATLRESHREADRVNDVAMLALSQDYIGSLCLRRGDLDGAEEAFLRAYLIRRLRKPDEIGYSLAHLARLRLARNDAASAENLYELAIAATRTSPSLFQPWALYHGRGSARLARGRTRAAFDDFAAAVDFARRWRLDTVASDALRIRADVGLHEIYHSYIRSGNQLALGGQGLEFARRAFSASEAHRAASLRERWNASGEGRRSLPDAYWSLLAGLRAAEIAAVQDPESPAAARGGEIRLRLIEMEAAGGAPAQPPVNSAAGDLSERIQRRLSDSEALLAFEFGDEDSFLWVVTRRNFAVHKLAGRRHLSSLVERFREAVRRGGPEADPAGTHLFDELFRAAGPGILAKAHWTLVLDDLLFQAPLPALVTGHHGQRPVYLVEDRSLMIVPNAAALLSGPSAGSVAERTLFVGLGDPVYNSADPRWKRDGGGKPPLELPRLVGSGPEIRRCAGIWRTGEILLLEGADASRERLLAALQRRPAVLHLATHIVAPSGRPESALIALSLRRPGGTEALTTDEIAALPGSGMVVLSGCHSGDGAALPGAGLIGLTRAWLAAGAERVVASLWPTQDDTGDLFLALYRHLGGDPRRAARALRQAQIDMLHSGDWRAVPRYWAAYFVTGKG